VKILAVMGSPRGKGAGYRIVRKIEERMQALGDVKFEYLFLKDADLKPCLGCYTCLAKGEEKCPLKDDRAAIVQRLLAVDGVILSSPIYVANVSALMKNFIERLAYNNHRPQFHRQKVLRVVNMAGDNPKTTLAFLKYALGGSRMIKGLGVATPPWLQTERAVAGKERAIARAAAEFHRACLDTSLPSPTLQNLGMFLVMQRLYLECPQVLPADYAYYRGKTYYYETKINPVKAALAKAIVGVMLYFMKDIGPGSVAWPVTQRREDTRHAA